MGFRNAACVIAILVLGCVARAGPRIVLPDDPQGDDVRSAAREFFRKLANADDAGAKALFDGPPDQADLLEAKIRCVVALDKLDESLNKHFNHGIGESTSPLEMSSVGLRTQADEVSKRLLSVNGDLASVSGDFGVNHGLDLHRVGGRWLVTHLIMQPFESRAESFFLNELAGAADEIRARADGRGFPSAEAAMGDFDKRRRWADLRKPLAESAQHPATQGAVPQAASPHRQPPLDARNLQSLLGESFTSPAAMRFYDMLPGVLHISRDEENTRHPSLYVISREAGLELAFGARDGRLQTVFFHAEGNGGFGQFPGELPAGLSFADTRADVERKIGHAAMSMQGWTAPYYAIYPDKGIAIEYASPGARDPGIRIGSVILTIPKSADAATSRPAERFPRLAFRLVASDARPGDAAVETLPSPAQNRTMLPVYREVLLDESDVDELWVRWTRLDERPAIGLSLTAAGTRRLERTAAANQGKFLAVVLEGRVLIALQIKGTISTGKVIIDFGPATPAEVSDITERLHAVVTQLSPPPATGPSN